MDIEGKDKKLKCSLQCRILSHRLCLQKYSADASNLVKSKLGLTKHLFKHNARLSGILGFEIMNEINRESKYMNELKSKIEHLKVKEEKKQKKMEKKQKKLEKKQKKLEKKKFKPTAKEIA